MVQTLAGPYEDASTDSMPISVESTGIPPAIVTWAQAMTTNTPTIPDDTTHTSMFVTSSLNPVNDRSTTTTSITSSPSVAVSSGTLPTKAPSEGPEQEVLPESEESEPMTDTTPTSTTKRVVISTKIVSDKMLLSAATTTPHIIEAETESVKHTESEDHSVGETSSGFSTDEQPQTSTYKTSRTTEAVFYTVDLVYYY